MLDSLGSTLSTSTINSFFIRHGKQPTDEIPIEFAIQCLETEICRPHSERRRLDAHDDQSPGTSLSQTPLMQSDEPKVLGQLDFSGVTLNEPPPPPPPPEHSDNTLFKPNAPAVYSTAEPMQQQPPLANATILDSASTSGSDQVYSSHSRDLSETEGGSEDSFERVINVKNCPLCHRPRLNSKADMDIVTHLAVCASSDWATVNRIMVGNFVTASQAQRKWYTKVLSKVSSGNYRLGAVSGDVFISNL
jgi:phosphatidylserine decarboxylase